MSFSVSTWNYLCSYPETADLNRAVGEIKADGFDLELWLAWWPDMHLFERRNWDSHKELVSGFSNISLHSALFGERDYDFDDLRAELDLGAFLGAKVLVIHYDTLKLDGTKADKAQLRRIKQIVKYGRDKNVAIALENGPLDVLKQAVDACGIKLCIDFGHAHINPDHSIYDFLDEFSDGIVHLHFSDNAGYSDQHLVPGKGSIAWEPVMASIKRLNFSGQYVLELNTANARQAAIEARAFVSSFSG